MFLDSKLEEHITGIFEETSKSIGFICKLRDHLFQKTINLLIDFTKVYGDIRYYL